MIRNPIIYQRGVVSPVGDPVGLVDEEVLMKVWAISSRALSRHHQGGGKQAKRGAVGISRQGWHGSRP